jgi:hypothetical protein
LWIHKEDGQCLPISAASYVDEPGLCTVFPVGIQGGGKIHIMLLDINLYQNPILFDKEGPDKHIRKLAQHQHAFRKSWVKYPAKRNPHFQKLLKVIGKVKQKVRQALPFDFNSCDDEFFMVNYFGCVYIQLI